MNEKYNNEHSFCDRMGEQGQKITNYKTMAEMRNNVSSKEKFSVYKPVFFFSLKNLLTSFMHQSKRN